MLLPPGQPQSEKSTGMSRKGGVPRETERNTKPQPEGWGAEESGMRPDGLRDMGSRRALRPPEDSGKVLVKPGWVVLAARRHFTVRYAGPG